MIQRVRAGLASWRQLPPALHAIAKRLQRVEQAIAALAATPREKPRPDGSLAPLARIEAQLTALAEEQAVMARQLRQLQAGVDGLVRKAYVDPAALPYPERLAAQRFRLHSQGQEDGLLWALFAEIGVTSRTFIELGSGASGGNAAAFALEFGWTGLMVEGNPASLGYAARRFPNVTAISAWITRETVNALIADHGFAREVDLLSLDIDGNDYWVWEALTAARPRVVMLEYNSIFGRDRSVTIPYDPKFNRREHRFCFYGASLLAMTRLSARKGYRLVAVDPAGVNAVFLRDDLAPHIPACDPRAGFHMKDGYNQFVREKNVDIFEWAAGTGRELVTID